MNPEKLLMELRERCFSVRLEDRKLVCVGIPGSMNTELKEMILKDKVSLIQLLETEERIADETGCDRKPYIDYSKSPPELRGLLDRAHPRFRYWQKGQCLYATLVELNAPKEMFKRYVHNLDRLTSKIVTINKRSG